MKTYHSSLTQSYKKGWIYSAVIEGQDVIKVQVEDHAPIKYVKSIHAAKILITKHLNKKKQGVKL